ncbi:11108_t:CDS:2 [Paraglomus brasilianum]|uniref:11108_t:CDS:1 n=1 Tax=Paraglomus brasilianum TaxID=144538 RepID=A0A9N8WGZ3_9GLOM|nr:11108_t:CDS:2 [Paraglomus brasilianum]
MGHLGPDHDTYKQPDAIEARQWKPSSTTTLDAPAALAASAKKENVDATTKECSNKSLFENEYERLQTMSSMFGQKLSKEL